MGGAKSATPDIAFPPVPTWEPSFDQPRDRIVDRLHYYANGKRDFVLLKHGTCVVLDDGLSDEVANSFALMVLSNILPAPGYDPKPDGRRKHDGPLQSSRR